MKGFGDGMRLRALDVTKPLDLDQAVNEALSAFTGLSILVHNGGRVNLRGH